MDIGRVIGTVVATQKDSSLEGTRLLIVQRLDAKGESVGQPLVATDTHCQAGRGDTIYMVTGGDAVGVLPERKMPVDAAIVGIVDSLSHAEEPPSNGEA
ncbi:MAG: EutN/CcmL family microcompartment protein [Candidatus Poribacteria bacterium]|nr:EutN/CcmL family microcompartment protein [Candidatus Poribacteria bacterium]MDE0504322.1 EutN/CcmL family microcompartment protein [Candidatus Poribacteria bacterium]